MAPDLIMRKLLILTIIGFCVWTGCEPTIEYTPTCREFIQRSMGFEREEISNTIPAFICPRPVRSNPDLIAFIEQKNRRSQIKTLNKLTNGTEVLFTSNETLLNMDISFEGHLAFSDGQTVWLLSPGEVIAKTIGTGHGVKGIKFFANMLGVQSARGELRFFDLKGNPEKVFSPPVSSNSSNLESFFEDWWSDGGILAIITKDSLSVFDFSTFLKVSATPVTEFTMNSSSFVGGLKVGIVAKPLGIGHYTYFIATNQEIYILRSNEPAVPELFWKQWNCFVLEPEIGLSDEGDLFIGLSEIEVKNSRTVKKKQGLLFFEGADERFFWPN